MTTTAVSLPPPRLDGGMTLAAALAARRSVRDFSGGALALADLGQVLWAAQGRTPAGRRTAPSAGALYPIELFVVAARVEGLAPGVWHYRGEAHRIERRAPGDFAPHLARAALDQPCVAAAAATLVVLGIPERTAVKYGARAARYVALEAGHVAQNALLAATALGLGAVPVGAFDDAAVQAVVGQPGTPLCLIPLGRRPAQ